MTSSESDKSEKTVREFQDTAPGASRTSGYPTDLTYKRLENLLEISQILNHFESVATTFPKILKLVIETFPIVSAVLIENRSGEPVTNVWLTSDFGAEQVAKTLAEARGSFSYFLKSSPEEISTLNQRPIDSTALLEGKLGSSSGEHFLLLPLVVSFVPVFGVLQLQAREAIREKDVKFANALANLIAVVIDRHYRIQNETFIAAGKEKQIRGERDQSRELTKILEEERSLREKFVQTLSHDLRVPLAVVHMTAQFLARSSTLSGDDFEMVKKIVRNANRLGHMIDSLLDANRLQAGEALPLDLEECDFCDILQEVVSEMNELADGTITFKCTEKVLGTWDPSALRRLSENLIGNAVKYREPETPIEVRLQKEGATAMLCVHNCGNPIPMQDQVTLFNQFRRTGQAQQSGKAGWGIGLTLVKGITEGHGGHVSVESNADLGTTFTVKIPLEIPADANTNSREMP